MKKLSTLFLSTLFAFTASAQIPNPGFETWTAATGYETPNSWGTANPLTTAFSVYTCEKGTTSAPEGSNYIKLTSKSATIVTIPGIAVTGTIGLSGTTPTVSGGFPSTTRPASLSGKWQYMASGLSDHAHIMVFLSKWNTTTNKRDTVAYTDSVLSGMAMSWAPFDINLRYYSGKTPDSALIVLASSGTAPVAGSYLWVDALAFSGSVPSGVVTVNGSSNPTVIFPNPTSTLTTVYFNSNNGGPVTFSISGIDGKIEKTMSINAVRGENSVPVDVAALPRGIYFLRIESDGGTETKKIIVE